VKDWGVEVSGAGGRGAVCGILNPRLCDHCFMGW